MRAGHPTTNRGPTYYTQEHLNDIVSAADAAGLTVHIHAIGDRAVRSSLDAFADARRRNGVRDNRDQIAIWNSSNHRTFPASRNWGSSPISSCSGPNAIPTSWRRRFTISDRSVRSTSTRRDR